MTETPAKATAWLIVKRRGCLAIVMSSEPDDPMYAFSLLGLMATPSYGGTVLSTEDHVEAGGRPQQATSDGLLRLLFHRIGLPGVPTAPMICLESSER